MADLLVAIPIGTDIWPKDECEPLIVAVCLPLAPYSPWRLRGTHLLGTTERALRSLPKDAPSWGGDILRKLLHRSRTLGSLPECMVRRMLRFA